MSKAMLAIGLSLAALVTSATVVQASDAVLIEFTSPRCRFCVEMKPVIQSLEREGVAVRRVDVDKESDMAVRFAIKQLPTYVIFSGGKESARLVGLQNADVMRNAIASVNRTNLRPTNAQGGNSATDPGSLQAPQTRLAPMSGNLPVGYGGAASPQASEPMPTLDLANAVARAQAATVRLRVYEEVGYGIGTGTVIDTHADELLILTCGHLFRDNKGKTKVEVDLFYAGEVHTVEGSVLDYDAGDHDIGLVTVRTQIPIQPVNVLQDTNRLQNGASVFSFGCDRGANPSRRDTRITGINLYNQHLRLSNIEIAGAPIDGRSGGGLFDGQGNLIGVCNAADYDDDIGIYAGPGEVYWQLDRVGLQALYKAGNGPHPNGLHPNGLQPSAPIAQYQPEQSAGAVVPAAYSPANQNQPAAPNFDSDSEVIIILRNRRQPQEPTKVKVFDTPPPALLEMLRN